MIHGFLLGVIVTGSVLAALYFFKFWRRTRDFLFLAFAIFFVIEGLARVCSFWSWQRQMKGRRGCISCGYLRLFSILGRYPEEELRSGQAEDKQDTVGEGQPLLSIDSNLSKSHIRRRMLRSISPVQKQLPITRRHIL